MNLAMPAVGRWELSSGACEALKWVAFAAMVCDHIDVLWFNRSMPGLFAVGRLALPIFAMVLAYNMARPGADLLHLLRRLLLWGVPVQLVVIGTLNKGAFLPLNILLTFAVAVVAVLALQKRSAVLVSVAVFLGFFVDYSLIGVAVVVSAWWFFSSRLLAAKITLWLSLLLLCGLNGNAWALLGALAVFVASGVDVRLPRLRWLFWIGYPAHLVVLGWLAAA